MTSKIYKKAISKITAEERAKTVKLIDILSNLKEGDRYYAYKNDLICDLLKDPKGGHIVKKSIISWAKKVGLKPELNCEDKTSWWTVSI